MPLTALSAVVWTIVTTDYKALPVGTDLWHLDLQGKNFEAAQNPCKNDYKGWDLWKNQVAFRASPFTASLEKNLTCIQFMSFRTWHLYKCAEWIWHFLFWQIFLYFVRGWPPCFFIVFPADFHQFSIVFAGFPTFFLHFSISSAFHQFFAGPSWFFSPFHRFFYTCHCFSSVVHRFFGRARWFSLFCVILDLVSLLLLVILFSFLLYLHTGVVFSIARFWNWCCSCLWLFCSSFESVVCYCCSSCCCCCWLSSEGEGRIKKKKKQVGGAGGGRSASPRNAFHATCTRVLLFLIGWIDVWWCYLLRVAYLGFHLGFL